LPNKAVRQVAGAVVGVSLKPNVPLRFSRVWMNAVGRVMISPIGVTSRWTKLGGVETLIVEHIDSDPSCAVLYLHGGGYKVNSPIVYRALAGHIAKQAKARVFIPRYRLAPEHPCPAAIEDAVAVYRDLVTRERIEPSRIAIGGDSAGGGLTLSTTIALRDAGEDLPAVLALLSPWVDLTLAGESMKTNAEREPVLTEEGLRLGADQYRSSLPADDPRVSPLFADLEGLPPVIIQAGGDDVLLSEGERLAERLKQAGVEVDYRCFPDVWHVFQGFVGVFETADDAVEELSDKLRAIWPEAAPASAGS
jgi:monoterpene epsilon-lactone hydrolase